MAFQFVRWENPEIAACAFALPDLPCGVSYDLKKAVDAYRESVIDGENESEQSPLKQIAEYEARYLPDVITKMLILLHAEHAGLDGECLVLAASKEDEASIRKAEAVLADLYRQLPETWEDARRVLSAAVAAERDFDERIWNPAWKVEKAGGERIPRHLNDEMERLQEVRWHAEATLLDMPAPSLAEFAVKYLICFDFGRDYNGYTESLCAEAKRLLGVPHDAEANELTVLLASLNWRMAA
jgi:hypothetical protein